jgi:glycerophosphoryl diester phosphodiesterase
MNLERRVLIGHRGCAHRPENTLDAFEHGLADGAHGIECDVRTTADGALVVVHDADLARLTDVVCRLPGRPTRVDQLLLADVRTLDAGGAQVPTLEEVLSMIEDTAAFINVEVKHAEPRAVVDAIRRHRRVADRSILSNFDHEWLKAAKRLDPGLKYAVLIEKPLDDAGRYVREVGADVLAPGVAQATPALFDGARRHGVPVHVWTVNDPAEARRLLDLGASGLFSDYPERLRGLFT